MQYIKKNFDYPIVQSLESVTPLLRDDFTKAVVFKTPSLDFNGSKITDIENFKDLNLFWQDPEKQKGERIDPGRTTYTLETLTPESIQTEARKAGLKIEDSVLPDLHQKMTYAAKAFSNIIKKHLERDDFYMRIWQMWSSKKALGRTPFLHIDRTYLTGLWYADRATAEIYTGEVPEKVWNALSPQRKNEHQNDNTLREFSKRAQPHDIISMPTGSLIITKNSKEKNLNDTTARRSVCIHSSGNVPRLGQAGIVMVPKFTS